MICCPQPSSGLPVHQALNRTQTVSSSLYRNTNFFPAAFVILVSRNTSYCPIRALAEGITTRRMVLPLICLIFIPHLAGVRVSLRRTRTMEPLLSWGRRPEIVRNKLVRKWSRLLNVWKPINLYDWFKFLVPRVLTNQQLSQSALWRRLWWSLVQYISIRFPWPM